MSPCPKHPRTDAEMATTLREHLRELEAGLDADRSDLRFISAYGGAKGLLRLALDHLEGVCPCVIAAAFHTCSCGRRYTVAQWSELEFVGRQLVIADPEAAEQHDEHTVILRLCAGCGSSRAMRSDAERAAGILTPGHIERERDFLARMRAQLRTKAVA